MGKQQSKTSNPSATENKIINGLAEHAIKNFDIPKGIDKSKIVAELSTNKAYFQEIAKDFYGGKYKGEKDAPSYEEWEKKQLDIYGNPFEVKKKDSSQSGSQAGSEGLENGVSEKQTTSKANTQVPNPDLTVLNEAERKEKELAKANEFNQKAQNANYDGLFMGETPEGYQPTTTLSKEQEQKVWSGKADAQQNITQQTQNDKASSMPTYGSEKQDPNSKSQFKYREQNNLEEDKKWEFKNKEQVKEDFDRKAAESSKSQKSILAQNVDKQGDYFLGIRENGTAETVYDEYGLSKTNKVTKQANSVSMSLFDPTAPESEEQQIFTNLLSQHNQFQRDSGREDVVDYMVNKSNSKSGFGLGSESALTGKDRFKNYIDAYSTRMNALNAKAEQLQKDPEFAKKIEQYKLFLQQNPTEEEIKQAQINDPQILQFQQLQEQFGQLEKLTNDEKFITSHFGVEVAKEHLEDVAKQAKIDKAYENSKKEGIFENVTVKGVYLGGEKGDNIIKQVGHAIGDAAAGLGVVLGEAIKYTNIYTLGSNNSSTYSVGDRIGDWTNEMNDDFQAYFPQPTALKQNLIRTEVDKEGKVIKDEKGQISTEINWEVFPYKVARGVADLGILIAGTKGFGAVAKGTSAASGIAMGARGTDLVNKTGMFAMSFSQSYNQSKKDALAKGASNKDAEIFAFVNSATTASLELISPNSWAFKGAGYSDNLFATMAKGGFKKGSWTPAIKGFLEGGEEVVKEGLEEGFQTAGGELVGLSMEIGRYKKAAETDQTFGQKMMESVIMGVAIGTPMGVGAGRSKYSQMSDISKAAALEIAINPAFTQQKIKEQFELQNIPLEKQNELLQQLDDIKETHEALTDEMRRGKYVRNIIDLSLQREELVKKSHTAKLPDIIKDKIDIQIQEIDTRLEEVVSRNEKLSLPMQLANEGTTIETYQEDNKKKRNTEPTSEVSNTDVTKEPSSAYQEASTKVVEAEKKLKDLKNQVENASEDMPDSEYKALQANQEQANQDLLAAEAELDTIAKAEETKSIELQSEAITPAQKKLKELQAEVESQDAYVKKLKDEGSPEAQIKTAEQDLIDFKIKVADAKYEISKSEKKEAESESTSLSENEITQLKERQKELEKILSDPKVSTEDKFAPNNELMDIKEKLNPNSTKRQEGTDIFGNTLRETKINIASTSKKLLDEFEKSETWKKLQYDIQDRKRVLKESVKNKLGSGYINGIKSQIIALQNEIAKEEKELIKAISEKEIGLKIQSIENSTNNFNGIAEPSYVITFKVKDNAEFTKAEEFSKKSSEKRPQPVTDWWKNVFYEPFLDDFSEIDRLEYFDLKKEFRETRDFPKSQQIKAKIEALKDKYNANDLILSHGTPHDFDKFQLDKIGTGEGVQAFGWGLYFTTGTKLAKFYAKKLSDDKKGIVYKVVIKLGKKKKWLEWREGIEDGDMGISSESLKNEITQDEFKKYNDFLKNENLDEKAHTGALEDFLNGEFVQGAALYKDIADTLGDKRASEIMLSLDIAGIKFRSNGNKGDDWNYVVFDESMISIVEKSKESEITSEKIKQQDQTTDFGNRPREIKINIAAATKRALDEATESETWQDLQKSYELKRKLLKDLINSKAPQDAIDTAQKIVDAQQTEMHEKGQELIKSVFERETGLKIESIENSIGRFDGVIEPSHVITFKVKNDAEFAKVEEAAKNFSERTLQDAYIITQDITASDEKLIQEQLGKSSDNVMIHEVIDFGERGKGRIVTSHTYSFDKPLSQQEISQIEDFFLNSPVESFTISNNGKSIQFQLFSFEETKDGVEIDLKKQGLKIKEFLKKLNNDYKRIPKLDERRSISFYRAANQILDGTAETGKTKAERSRRNYARNESSSKVRKESSQVGKDTSKNKSAPKDGSSGAKTDSSRNLNLKETGKIKVGKETEVVFSTEEKSVMGYFAYVELSEVQASNTVDGKPNALKHFISKAQPKKWTDDRETKANKMRDNLRPNDVMGEASTPYSGTPVLNERGEVIQGNGRAVGLGRYYKKGKDNSYKEKIIKEGESYGLNPKDAEGMKNPVLVRIVPVSDKEAIRLGQKKSTDIESGGDTRVGVPNAVTTINSHEPTRRNELPALQQIASIFGREDYENRSIAQLLLNSEFVKDVLDVMFKVGAINTTERSNMLTDGLLNAKGKADLTAIFDGLSLTRGVPDSVSTMEVVDTFGTMPASIQEAINESTKVLLEAGKGVGNTLYNAFRAYNTFRKYQKVFGTFDNWVGQTGIDVESPVVTFGKDAINMARFFAENSENKKIVKEGFGYFMAHYTENLKDRTDVFASPPLIKGMNQYDAATAASAKLLEKYKPEPKTQGRRARESRGTATRNSQTQREAATQMVGRLKKSFPNINVEFDDTLTNSNGDSIPGVYKDGKIVLNPTKMTMEDALEEHAHLYLELATAMNPTLVAEGERIIKASPEGRAILDEVKKDYPDLSKKAQYNEAIAKAIARYGVNVKKPSVFTRFVDSIRKSIGNGLRRVLGDKSTYFTTTQRLNPGKMSLAQFSKAMAKDMLRETPLSYVDSQMLEKFASANTSVQNITVERGLLQTEATKLDRFIGKVKMDIRVDMNMGKWLGNAIRSKKSRIEANSKEVANNTYFFRKELQKNIKEVFDNILIANEDLMIFAQNIANTKSKIENDLKKNIITKTEAAEKMKAVTIVTKGITNVNDKLVVNYTMQNGFRTSFEGVKLTGKDLKAAEAAYATQLAQDANQALRGELPFEDLPEGLRSIVKTMRTHIDRMTQSLIDEGLVPNDDLVGQFNEELSIFIRRNFDIQQSIKSDVQKGVITETEAAEKMKNITAASVSTTKARKANENDVNITFTMQDGSSHNFTGLNSKDIYYLFGKDKGKKIMSKSGNFDVDGTLLYSNPLYAVMMANKGKYVNRSYAIHRAKTLEDYLNTVDGPTMQEAFNLFANRLRNPEISSVQVQKMSNGNYSLTFQNKYGRKTDSNEFNNLTAEQAIALLYNSDNEIGVSNTQAEIDSLKEEASNEKKSVRSEIRDIDKELKPLLEDQKNGVTKLFQKIDPKKRILELHAKKDVLEEKIDKINQESEIKIKKLDLELKRLNTNNEAALMLKESINDTQKTNTFEVQMPKRVQSPFVKFTASQVEINAEIKTFLANQIEKVKEDDRTASSKKPARKNTGILKSQQDIPKELRELMGEDNDPQTVYENTAMKMANLLHSQELINTLWQEGGEALFSDTKTNTLSSKRIAADGNSAYAPLDGKYTSPEMYDLLFKGDSAEGKQWSDKAIAAWLFLNGTAKAALTVYSLGSNTRNLISANIMTMKAGVFNPLNIPKAYQITRENVRPGKYQDFYNQGIKLGVFSQNIDAEIFKAQMDRSIGKTDFTLVENLKKFASKVYQFPDDMAKAMALLDEIQTERKAAKHTGEVVTEQQIMERAAEKVKATLPNYSIAPKAMQNLSRNAILGSFVMFQAETLRNTWNTFGLAFSEIRSDNPVYKAKGVRRLASITAMLSAAPILALEMASKIGLEEEEEEGIRAMLPEYQRNSVFLWTGRNSKGEPQYLDLSYIDPSTTFHKPLVALATGQDYNEKFKEVLREVYQPFLGMEIFTKDVYNAVTNENDFGRKIAPDNSRFWGARKRVTEAGKDLIPKVGYESAYMLMGALNEFKNDDEVKYQTYTRDINLAEEVTNNFLGTKLRTFDASKRFSNVLYTIKDAQTNGSSLLKDKDTGVRNVSTATGGKAGEMSGDSKLDTARKNYREAAKKVYLATQAMRKYGYSNDEMLNLSKEVGFAKDHLRKILNGDLEYTPFDSEKAQEKIRN